jgi:hypothetical protein
VKYGKYKVLELTTPKPICGDDMCIRILVLESDCVIGGKRDPGHLREKSIEQKRTLLAALTICEEVKIFTQSLRLLDRIASCACVMGRKIVHVYLLSDHIRIMACLDFERAIVCPKIYRVCDAGYAAFENLEIYQWIVLRRTE